VSLENAPQQVLSIGPGTHDFILDLYGSIKAEILCKLTTKLALLDLVKNIGRKYGAFNANGGNFMQF
jgi:hypothetical protein